MSATAPQSPGTATLTLKPPESTPDPELLQLLYGD
jgi:hypothetical protein